MPNKESIDPSTWIADLKDYRIVLDTFDGYLVSDSLRIAVERMEKSGGPSFIPDIVLSRNENKLKVILPSYNSSIISKLNTIPQKQFNTKGKCWYFPPDRLRKLIESIHGYKIYTLKNIREEARSIAGELAEQREKRKENESLLAMADIDLAYDFKIQPFLHQKIGIRFLLNNTYAGLFDEQGLGKTEQLICALDILRNGSELTRAVIVCPNSVKFTWGDEITKHSNLGFTIIEGDKHKRRILFEQNTFFLILNYELLRIESEKIEALLKAEPSAIVFDESQKIKNRSTQTTKVAQKLVFHAKRRYIATGTPVGNKPEDLWSQISALDQGKLFGNYYDFLRDYCVLGNKYSNWAILKYKNLNELRDKLKTLSIRRLKNQVLDLPEKLYQRLHVDLQGQQLQLYQQMRDNLYITIRDMSEREIEQKAQNIMVHMLRLAQIASNPRLVDKNFIAENNKFIELDSLLEDLIYGDKKVILWTSYVDNVTELWQRYKKYNPCFIYGNVTPEDRFRVVGEFQDNPGIKILIGTPKSAREGLSLTKAETAIYIDRTFNAVDYWQSQDRIHRIGQRGSCTIINLIARNTIDDYIDSVLEMKREYSISALGDEEEPPFSGLKLTKGKLLDLLKSEKYS